MKVTGTLRIPKEGKQAPYKASPVKQKEQKTYPKKRFELRQIKSNIN